MIANKANSVTRILPSSIAKGRIKESAFLREIKKVDPTDRYVVIFPDSRNVYPGMGIDLLGFRAVERIYEEASDLAKQNILKLCTKPEDGEITKNLRNEYLAAYVTSHATITKFKFERPHDHEFCKGAGGIGIGILNSLVFSGAMTFQDGLDLLLKYSQAMEKTAQIIPNSRLIVRMKPATNKNRVCQAAIEHCLELGIPEEIAVCSVASHIRQQLVIFAGHEEAIKYIESEGYSLFDFWEMRRDKRMPHAYHSRIMNPAGEFIRAYIDDKLKHNPDYICDPRASSVYSSVYGGRLRFRGHIIKDLYNFPTRPVNIETMLQSMFRRPDDVPQPNSVVPWDRYLMKTLFKVNRKAFVKAKLLSA